MKNTDEKGTRQTPYEELLSERKVFEERESTMLENSLENLDKHC